MNRHCWVVGRILSLLLVAAGLIVYLFLAYVAMVGFTQDPISKQPLIERINYLVEVTIFASGAIPLAITICFFGVNKSARIWIHGLLFLPLFILLQWIADVFVAHAPPMIYRPIMWLDVLLAFYVIRRYCWQPRHRLEIGRIS